KSCNHTRRRAGTREVGVFERFYHEVVSEYIWDRFGLAHCARVQLCRRKGPTTLTGPILNVAADFALGLDQPAARPYPRESHAVGFTRFGGRFPASAARTLRAAITHISRLVSIDELAICGASTTLFSFNKSAFTVGSRSKTSRPAPAIQPSDSALATAASSITGPRAVFTRMALFFIRRSSGSPINFRVPSFSGV